MPSLRNIAADASEIASAAMLSSQAECFAPGLAVAGYHAAHFFGVIQAGFQFGADQPTSGSWP
jgi:hypothetical protein